MLNVSHCVCDPWQVHKLTSLSICEREELSKTLSFLEDALYSSYTAPTTITDSDVYGLGGFGDDYSDTYYRGTWRVKIWYANSANPSNTNAMIASRSFYLQ